MKTFYRKFSLLKVLKLPALIFFLLAMSYSSKAGNPTSSPANPVCYGTTVSFTCGTQGGCGATNALYQWFYYDSNSVKQVFVTPGTTCSPSLANWCDINVCSYCATPQIVPGDAVYEFISQQDLTTGAQIFLGIQYDPYFSAGSVIVKITPKITVTGVVTNLTCFGASNGAITTTITGGVLPLSYNWSNGATTPSLSNVSAGTYTITVTDQDACPVSKSFTVTAPASSIVINGNVTHVNCNGASTGAISVTATGGTSPFTYNWSNGGAGQSISGLSAATYTVTATDNVGCTATTSFSVTQASALGIASTVSHVTCFNGNNGSISITASGGTTAYTYKWSSGGSTSSISGLSAITYTVTVTDSKSCSKTASFTLTQPTVITITTAVTNVGCFGGATGSINTTVTGGTTGYTYTWSNSTTLPNLTGVSSGTYTVTVKDANNCTKTASAFISQPAAGLSIVETQTNVSCFGQTTGAINITVTGGTQNYGYKWSNGQTTQNIANLSAMTFTVTVTDANNCTLTGSWTLSQPASLPNYVAIITAVNCFGQATGAINVTPTGGTPGYTFKWSTGATTQNLSGLTAGTYTLTLTDANGCQASSGNDVNQPAAALNLVRSITDVKCFGEATGSFNITVTGGTTAYGYKWSNNATTQNLTNVTAGNYCVTVTDAKGCTITNCGTISQPTAALAIAATQTNVACFGQTTGAINITVTGGTLNYGYKWSNGSTAQNIANLSAMAYTVTVTDANNCTKTGTWTLTQPPSLPNYIAIITAVNCFGQATGAINVTPTGGTPNYTFKWSTGATTQNLSGLTAGTYTLTLTDANGCQASSGNDVNQPLAALNLTRSITDVKCFGDATGSFNITVTGGTTAYGYKWSNNATTQNLTNVTAGSYCVTVTDAKGCTITNCGTISQPTAALAIAATQTNVACFGQTTGAINITVTGGTLNYGYKWSNGQTTQNIANLSAITFTVTVTDANNCTKTGSWTLTQPPSLPNYVAIITPVNCFGQATGAINVTPTGGTPGYTFKWSTGATTQNLSGLTAGTYTLTLTDANGCQASSGNDVQQPAAALNLTRSITDVKCFGDATGSFNITVTGGTTAYGYKWSNNATTQNLTNVTAGSYCVTVTDAKGCTITNCGTISQPTAALAIAATQTNVACFGQTTGAINITVTGGTLNYGYKWSNGQTTQNIANLSAITFTVTVTDANNCTKTGSWTLTQPPSLPNYIAIITAVNCFGQATGAINVTPTGGTPGYTFKWSTGATTQNLSGLTAGTYTLTLTDANGCQASSGNDVQQPAAALNLTRSITDVKCFGDATGSFNITVTGGTTAYGYKWSNNATTQNLTNVTAGFYCVTVTDAKGCTITNCGTISQPTAALAIAATQTNVACFGQTTGAINITVTGGTLNYGYKWSNGSTAQNIANLSAMAYTVTVTDANNCTKTGTWTLTQPPSLPNYIAIITPVVCFGQANGTISVTPTGGTPGYTYKWSTGATTQNLSGLTVGTYTLTLTDANGCQASSQNDVGQPTLLTASTTVTPVSCFNGNNGSATASGAGGNAGGYSYKWSNSQTTQTINNLTAATYTVTVTDTKGCSATATALITQPTQLTATVTTTPLSCYQGADGTATVSASGGTTGYTYAWSTTPTKTTSTITGLTYGSYVVTVTDKNGCTKTASGFVTQPDQLVVTLTGYDVTCYGYANGYVTSTVTGGTSPYSYSWNNGKTTANINNLTAGSYCVFVTDAHGCSASNCITISEPPPWGCLIINGPQVVCQGSTAVYCACTDQLPGVTYSWTIIGGTIICCHTDPCVWVKWDNCITGQVCLTITRHDPPYDGCQRTICMDVKVCPVPSPVITGPLTVNAGDTTDYYTNPGYLASWSVVGATVIQGMGTNHIKVVWNQCGPCDPGKVTVCLTDTVCGLWIPYITDNSNGYWLKPYCCGCESLDINIMPTTASANLYGYVTYDNTYGTPLNGVTVTLRDKNGIVCCTTTTGPNFMCGTGAPGFYAFNNVPISGNPYTMQVSYNGTWGGVNATDALIIQLHTVAPFLTGLRLKAGDVNADLVVNSTDALWVKLRTVGMVTSFPAGDWVFETALAGKTFTVPLTPDPCSITPPPSTAGNFKGICYGDVNGSYVPTGFKEASFLSTVDDGVITVPVDKTFTYTINSARTADIGAMTMFLDYDQNRFEIANVNTSIEGVKYMIKDGKVSIAWSNTTAMSVNNNDAVVSLQMKAKEAITEPAQVFTINTGSEFADAYGIRYENFDLKLANILTTGAGEFSIMNYPNPFQNTTQIVYTIPEQGHVKLTITNMFGAVITTLVDAEQASGSYTLKVNPSEFNMRSGVYLYQIEVTGATTSYNKTGKMLFTK